MLNKKMFALPLLSSLICLSAFAASANPIDKKADACMEKNYSTVGMQDCQETAYKEWDAALNTAYKALQKAQGSDKAKAALKASQQKWLKFRDSELNFINKMYQDQEGTYWGTVAGGAKTDLIKTRVQTLQERLDSLSPEK